VILAAKPPKSPTNLGKRLTLCVSGGEKDIRAAPNVAQTGCGMIRP
jgi:hypothetical protein